MNDTGLLGRWLRRFLEEHIVSERNLARNTQISYRDTLVLLLPFVADKARTPVDRLTVRDLSAERVLAFLAHLEGERGCSPRTRNQRLAAIRSFARYVAARSPEHVEWCGQIRAIALKKTRAPRSQLPRKARTRCLARRSGHHNTSRPPRTRLVVVLVPYGCPSIRGGTLESRCLAPGRQEHKPLARYLARQGRQNTRVPAPVGFNGGTCGIGGGAWR